MGPGRRLLAREENPPLVVTPINSTVEARVPMTFDISMGVRRTDKQLKAEVDPALSSLAPQINAILAILRRSCGVGDADRSVAAYRSTFQP